MKNYTSIKHNHRYKMIERDFIESAIVNTPELSYNKVQNKNIGE